MVFKRKNYEAMLEWKKLSDGKTALLIEGARRIGKTTLAEEFAKREYEDYLILDFSKESKDVREQFLENLGNLNSFFQNIFLLKGKSLEKRKSAIIFDEVQLFPPARQAIKHLVLDGRFDYIETGSLIGIKRKSTGILIPSEEHRIHMYPMDFEEFLWAQNDTVTAEAIKQSFESRIPLSDAVHRKIMKTFRTYMATGGMPQAVDAFVQGKSFEEIDFLKRSILSLYEEDLAKFDEEYSDKASAIFRSIPEQLSNHNSKFKFSVVGKEARFRNHSDAVDFISKSMIGNKCTNVTEPEVSLDLHSENNNFKLFLGDTGLLVSQILQNSKKTGPDIYKALLFDRLSINEGMIFENMVAQMLRANGYKLFFNEFRLKTDENKEEHKYEVDFLIVRSKRICPIEVKSSSYCNHESLDNFNRKFQIKTPEKYIIYSKNLKQIEGITCIPIYMTMCL